MRLKQSNEEYLKNLEAVEKKLLPAVIKNTAKNGERVVEWMMEPSNDCCSGDVVDASEGNIRKAIDALHGIGFFDWDVPPVKKPAKKQPDFLQTNDGARQNQPKNVELDIQIAQEKKRREALGNLENGKIMAEAAKLVREHNPFPHSRRIRETTALKREFDRLVASKVHPKEVLAGVKALQDSFAGEDITRPRVDK
jgi:hypothetical protein